MASFSTLRHNITRSIAGVAVGLLVATGFVTASPAVAPATAATGAISDFEFEVVDDGTSVAPGDTSPTDGIVGLGNNVQFSWRMTLTDLIDGEITQEVPAGWAWDRASLDASGLQNPSGENGYTSTYSLSNQSRTLTVNIASVGSGPGNAGVQLVEFDALHAGPKRFADAVGTVYSPTLTVHDGDATREITPSGGPNPLETVGVHLTDMRKRAISSGGGFVTPAGQEKDFGLGDGPEPAAGFTFGVSLRNEAVTTAGSRPITWQNPVRIHDRYTLSSSGVDPSTLPQLIEITGEPSYGVTAELQNIDTAAGTFDILLSGEKLNDDQYFAGYGSVEVTLYIPKRLAPAATEPSISISNTVTESLTEPWLTESGLPLADTGSSETTVTGWIRLRDDSSLPPTFFDPKVSGSMRHADESITTRFNRYVYPGFELKHRVEFQPYGLKQRDSSVYEVPATEDLSLYEFWNAGEYELGAPGELVTELGAPLKPGVDYRVLVTDEGGDAYAEANGSADPRDLPWVSLDAYTGERSAINGLRYEFVEPYVVNSGEPVTKMAQAKVRVDTVLKVTRPYVNGWPETGLIETHGRVTATTQSQATPQFDETTSENMIIRASAASPVLKATGLDSAGNPLSSSSPITAGQKVRYTASPRLSSIDGSPAADSELAKATSITGLQVEMLLAENLVLSTIDFSQIDTRAWRWEFGDLDDEGRMPLTFFYKIPIHAMQTVASPVVFDVTTSQIAPPAMDSSTW